eukprot:TRINITY_DN6925_c0_g1_i1.p1 TRINITY_DN6925_c0_g1~~TRINITY_DN6925_c0_g1_i1.p1  ORF type:complete len:208 (+),score=45.40 TRINITY_DN6925_c0_g1_i1:80-703(+)
MSDSVIIDENAENQIVAKLVLLGESDVGKSSLVYRFVKEKYMERRESTIGAAFLTKLLLVGADYIKFEIWDTAGQERYHSLAPMYYRDAQAACVLFDVTVAPSFEKAKKWITDLKKGGRSDIVIALVGNKTDLPNRQVQFEAATEYARANELLYIETSVKTNYNVRELFNLIGEKLPKTRLPVPRSSIAIQPIDDTRAPPDNGCCRI